MGETTAIEWTNHTFNPWIGCTIVSAECDNCYAKALADARGWAEWGRGKTRHLTKTWGNPRKWNQEAELEGRRPRVFCSSLADVFDAEVPEEYRQTLWPLIRETPHLDWQLLTKRPNLIKQMLPPDLVNAPHIWLGTSVGMPATTWRIPKLLETPAVVHFVSIEPLLGPIPNLPLDGIEWVILGGESGQAVCSSPEEREVSDMGTKRAVSEAARLLGRLGGQTTSPAKARAARKNAKLGGWPKGRPRKPQKGATT